MRRFQFVPGYIENMAVGALEHLPGMTLANIITEGSYSRYRAIYAYSGGEVEVLLVYDFALLKPEHERGAAVAELVNRQMGFPKTKTIGDFAAVVPQVEDDLRHELTAAPLPAADDPPPNNEPKKPIRGRRNKAVSDSKDGE